ncbi:MAG TPA: MgtC/SapB family protein [Polyangiaceae bacterium]|nr:MgtC/SapB family protein [Polyangiaceae bacterium]
MSQGATIGETLIRLVIACVLGALIGWDRERQEKPAGLRTHILVSLGSASFTMLGFEVGAHLVPRTGDGFDPTRVLQGVIGGIGFLGAGAIIQNRGQVSGITTAASVWVAGAMGAAAGVGAYVLAAMTALLTLITLRSLTGLERRAKKNAPEQKGPSQPEERSKYDPKEQAVHGTR